MLLVLHGTLEMKSIIPCRSILHAPASSVSYLELRQLPHLQRESPLRFDLDCPGPHDLHMHLRCLDCSLLFFLLLSCKLLLLELVDLILQVLAKDWSICLLCRDIILDRLHLLLLFRICLLLSNLRYHTRCPILINLLLNSQF